MRRLRAAVVLLHGHPRTHTTWHRVAPLLVAAGHTVVCPDLRGYGRWSKPPTTPDHAPYSKRDMAGDVVALMRRLGHERFAVAWWHWFFFAQPDKPERAINADPAVWYGAHAPGQAAAMGVENHADYVQAMLWSRRDDLEDLFGNPLAIWVDWTTDLRGGHSIDSGHHLAEEAPGELANALVSFLSM